MKEKKAKPGTLQNALGQQKQTERSTDGTSPIKKTENKSYEEITASTVIEIPVNSVKPVNCKIFVVEVRSDERRTQSGIIIPSRFAGGANPEDDAKGKEIQRNRYYVVDVAHDCPIETSPGVKLKRGDEVCVAFPTDATAYYLPNVIDYVSGKLYSVLDYTEIAGATANETEVLEK